MLKLAMTDAKMLRAILSARLERKQESILIWFYIDQLTVIHL